MGDSKAHKKQKRNNIIKRVIDISLALAVAGGAIYCIRAVMNDFSDIDRKPQSNVQNLSTSAPETPDADKIIYVTETADNENVYSGPLIIVNSTTEYKGSDKNLVSMYDVKLSDGTEDYLVMSSDVKVRTDASSELNKMVKAFTAETGNKNIIIDGGYRSIEYQQELYDATEDKSAAAAPGTSDYHTGYSIDLSINSEDGSTVDFTAEGDYAWFEKNCYKYGFIVRFPEGKKDVTGYDYRPWHFRYVGKAHAYYMYTNKLCLEEYVEKLKTFEYTQTHLIFTDDNGVEYETYYYPADMTSSTSILAVPDAGYEISGNNSDGFIITFRRINSSSSQTGTTVSDQTNTTETSVKSETATEIVSSDISEETDSLTEYENAE